MRELKKLLKFYGGFVIPVIIFVFAICAVYFGIYPAIGRIQTLQSDIKKLEDENEKIKNRLTVLQSLDERTLRDQMDLLLSAVPAEKSLPTVFTTVEGAAASSEVTIMDFTIDSPGSLGTESAQVKTSNISGKNILTSQINAGGENEKILNFFDTLLSIRRLLSIEKFSINFNKEININEEIEDVGINPAVTINAFYASIPVTLGKPTDKLEPLTANEEKVLKDLNTYRELESELGPDFDASQFPVGTKPNPFAS